MLLPKYTQHSLSFLSPIQRTRRPQQTLTSRIYTTASSLLFPRPRATTQIHERESIPPLKKMENVVVIGIHGWFPSSSVIKAFGGGMVGTSERYLHFS
jgi:hypothetical protein